MNNHLLSRLSHPFAIDLEMLAVFRWLLAAIVIWGLVGRVQIRDYVFSIPPAAAVETAPWPVKAPADALALAPSRDSTAAEPTTVRTVLLTSDESRSVWTPWHWSVLWLDQVIARIRTTLMSVEPVRRAEDLAGPAGPGERVERGEPTVTPPVYFAWNDALARWQAFFASQWWFDGVLGLGIASGILFGVDYLPKQPT
jgi:hypothetical protein